VDLTVPLPSGELIEIPAGTEIKSVLDSLIVGAVEPAEGKTGIGDFEVGALYNFHRSESWIFTTGLGLRLPTSAFDDTPRAYRPTGKGLVDLALRLNLEFSPLTGLWLTTQNQFEYALTERKSKRTSLVSNRHFNDETPTDGEKNSVTYEEKGVRTVGFAQVSYGLGAIYEPLKSLVVYSRYGYVFDRAVYRDSVRQSTGSEMQYVGGGFTVSLLPYQLPFAMDVLHERAVDGKNKPIVAPTDVTTVTFKAYARF
jgi:hypothetical protein